jgi:hypothetical protein
MKGEEKMVRRIVFRTLSEVLAAVKSGEVDFTGINATPARAKDMDFTAPKLNGQTFSSRTGKTNILPKTLIIRTEEKKSFAYREILWFSGGFRLLQKWWIFYFLKIG